MQRVDQALNQGNFAEAIRACKDLGEGRYLVLEFIGTQALSAKRFDVVKTILSQLSGQNPQSFLNTLRARCWRLRNEGNVQELEEIRKILPRDPVSDLFTDRLSPPPRSPSR